MTVSRRRAQLALKRALDFTIASAALVVLAPVLLALSSLVATRLGSPVLFRQRRPGRGGRPFELLKLRTMSDARDRSGNLLSDEQRLTRFGRFLRASSLDELPGLINVFKGEMSLVGPRPLLMEYLPLYTPQQMRRHEVRPGLTGWAQVNGRNAISWEEKFALDVWYVEHWSLALDVKIMIKTLFQVVKAQGINQPGRATMDRFTGSSR